MNIDKRIKDELENEATEIDRILANEKGLFGMLTATFTGSLRRWVWVGTVIGTLLTVFIFYSGYRFFIAPEVTDQLFWGVILLIAVHAQVAMKMWIWMEMNRASIVRETKRLEVAIARLDSR